VTDVPVDDPEVLRRILADTEALLLDFDGPICSVFAGFPAHVVADQLRDVLAEGGYRDLPDDVAKSEDPFDVFKYAATLGEEEARYVEAAFRAHEAEAIPTAEPTPGAHDLIRAWKATGRKLAIVSNNSTAAIETYLGLHTLHDRIDYIAARSSSDVTLLKPSSYLVNSAITVLQVPPAKSTLVGDSAADIEAAQRAAVKVIGYANRSSKLITLSSSAIVVTQLNLRPFIKQPE